MAGADGQAPTLPAGKRRWWRRAASSAPLSTVCPLCGRAGPVRLLSGERCATCRTQQAWTELGATGLVIDHATIAAAEQRRRGEAAGQPWWRAALVWVAPLASLTIAAAAVWSTRALFEARTIGPLAGLLDDLIATSRRATLVGLLAVVVGALALGRLRRRRHFRRLPFVLSHAAAAAVGGVALTLGGLHWLALGDGFGGAYTSMPPRGTLAVTSQVERIMNATVVVLAPGADGDARDLKLGTGAVVAADDHRAWIVTCSHVAMPYAAVDAVRHARDAQPVWVQLADGRGARARVRWAAPPPLDAVVLELPIEHPPEPVTISRDGAALATSASVTFVPNPYRSGWMVHHGALLRREPHRTPAGVFELMFTDLPVTHGDSGSGLFDARGQLVGLNTWTGARPGQAAQGISLPSEALAVLVDAIASGDLDRLDDTKPPTRE